MRLSEKVDHLLRQYNYRRKRGNLNNSASKQYEMEDYFTEVDSYIDEIMNGIDKFYQRKKG